MVDRDLRVEIDVLTTQLLRRLELDEEREQEKLDVERQLWCKFRRALKPSTTPSTTSRDHTHRDLGAR